MEPADARQEVAGLRRQFANRIESLDETAWSAASWCGGWRVRDVLAHLVRNAEATYTSLAQDLFRGGFRPDRTVDKAARRLGDVPVPVLAERLRVAAEGGVCLPGSPKAIGVGDVLVHSADAFRPLGLEVDAPPGQVIPALEAFCQAGRMIVHSAPHRDRLVATDVDWNRGSGPEISGKAMDLLLLVANRRQVLPCLEGPGLAGL